jgi:RNA polymerase sigma-70 factor (ECF subfamily)
VTDQAGARLLLDHLFRHQSGRMVSHLVRLLGPANLDLAEETVQEAMLRALQTWPYQGVPEKPPAWLFRVAHNIAIDAVRRKKVLGGKTEDIVAELSRSAQPAPDNPAVEEQLPS